MRAIELEAEISKDRKLEVQLPPDVEAQKARVIVLLNEAKAQPRDTTESTLALLDRLSGHRTWPLRSAAEIDRYLEEERESWERG
jgi:hypothetical protein